MEMTPANEAAAMWGSAENQAYPLDQRLACALKALTFYGAAYEAQEESEEPRSEGAAFLLTGQNLDGERFLLTVWKDGTGELATRRPEDRGWGPALPLTAAP